MSSGSEHATGVPLHVESSSVCTPLMPTKFKLSVAIVGTSSWYVRSGAVCVVNVPHVGVLSFVAPTVVPLVTMSVISATPSDCVQNSVLPAALWQLVSAG